MLSLCTEGTTDEYRSPTRAFLLAVADRTSQAVIAKSAADAGTIHNTAADPSTLATRHTKRLVMD
jgi:hypothetical protein